MNNFKSIDELLRVLEREKLLLKPVSYTHLHLILG